MPGNDGRTRVRVPDELHGSRTPSVRTEESGLLHALEAHNATLMADVERLEAQLRIEAERLAAAEARSDKQAADFAERDAQRVADLAAERARTEKAMAAAEARDTQHVADLTAERAKTEKAIETFASLAERLDALAAERERRPWWRRLVG